MLNYINNQLHFDNVNLNTIANNYGSPCYIYSADTIKNSYTNYTKYANKNTQIYYAVKANSNLSILKLLHSLGAGFDIVSIGELQRVIAATNSAKKVIFSGVGKSKNEIKFALEQNILCFNVESIAELVTIQHVAEELNILAPISLRINPNVDAKTHPYISTGLKVNKFGIAFEEALSAYKLAKSLPNLNIIGIDCHIGSQILDTSPFFDALDKILQLLDTLKINNITLKHIDVGGGIGIDYFNNQEQIPDISDFVKEIQNRIAQSNYANLNLFFEPGRSLVGNAGILLTKVEYLKQGEEKNFCIVDAAMNDLARPAMYDAFHAIKEVNRYEDLSHEKTIIYDVVGPVCESGDWLAKNCALKVKQEDYIAILSAGSYGFTMSSNYNTRPRVSEILIENGQARLIRTREEIHSLFELEIKYL